MDGDLIQQMNSLGNRGNAKPSQPSGHLNYLDALRGYAFLGVLIAHFSHDFSIKIPKYLIFFGYGVTLFYVLSAYCLMLSLHRQGKSTNWRAYWIRRFFRIAPAFYAAIALWSLFNLWNNRPLDAAKIIYSMVFLNGFIPDHIHSAIPHGWSVAIETSFYIILPLLFLWIRTLNQALVALCLATPVCIALSWSFPFAFPANTQNSADISAFTVYWLPAQIPVFLIGIATYFSVYGECKTSKNVRKILGFSSILPLGISLIIGLGSGYLPTRVAHIAVACGCATWIIWLSSHPKSLFANRIMVKTGIVSFSAYLFHQFSIDIVRSIPGPPDNGFYTSVAFVGAALISLLFAYAGYSFVEKPGIAWGSAIIKRNLKPDLSKS